MSQDKLRFLKLTCLFLPHTELLTSQVLAYGHMNHFSWFGGAFGLFWRLTAPVLIHH